MKLVNSEVEVIKQKPGIQGILENVEIGARTCYASEHCIKYDSSGNSITASGFVDKIVNVYKHRSVAEHGAVYLKIPSTEWNADSTSLINPWTRKLLLNPYIHETVDGGWHYVSTNYRVILENPEFTEIFEKYLVPEPEEKHDKRVTSRWVCDRACLAQLTRHRSLSFSVQSQRYVNYSKDKFGGQLTFVIPEWAKEILLPGEIDTLSSNLTYMNGNKIRINDGTLKFLRSLKDSGDSYLALTKSEAMKPEDARGVLPNATRTELIMTGFQSDLEKFFDLRCDPHAQADIRNLAKKLRDEMSILWG